MEKFKYLSIVAVLFLIACPPDQAFRSGRVVLGGEYSGKTFIVDLNKGGFNYSQNIDNVDATAMVEGTRNINLHKSGRSKRGGTDNVNSSVIGGVPRIYGVYQFRLQNGNTFILTADANGEILKDYDDANPLKTGLTINQAVHFVTFNNLCIITTGNDMPQVWDGAAGSTTDLANVPTDWTGGNYPRKMIKHGNQTSERLWAIYGKTDPFTVYTSDLNVGDGSTEPDFSDANVVTTYVDTGDGFGVINGIEFGDRFIMAGKNKFFIYDDTNVDKTKWGYDKSQWESGCGNDRLLVAAGNDIISMNESGDIYSVTASETYGDYRKMALTRPAFIDEWIRANIRLLSIDDFHAVYDPVLRCVYFFVVRQGKTAVDTAICYFVDRGPEFGWVIKDNLSSNSGYSASCSAVVRKAVGDNVIYTGGWSDGYVWQLETSTNNDNDAAYSSGFKTVPSHFGSPRFTKQYNTGWIVINSRENYNLLVDIWVDGVYIKQEAVSFSTGSAVYGTAIYGTDVYGGALLIETSFDIGVEGKRIQYHIYNNNANENFFATSLMTDFESLGRLP